MKAFPRICALLLPALDRRSGEGELCDPYRPAWAGQNSVVLLPAAPFPEDIEALSQ